MINTNPSHHGGILSESSLDYHLKTTQYTLIFTVIPDYPNYKTTTLPVTRDLAYIRGRNLRGSCTGDGPENPTPCLDRYYHAMCTGAIGGEGDCRDAEPLDRCHPPQLARSQAAN
ncbi:hypothetical protein OIU76_004400 [Salix suchowensis]|nr:hypothetical protein OIU76_004400 [Salix suchowensis]